MKPLLNEISQDLRAALLRLGVRRRYDAGRQIFTEGEMAGVLPIVISGAVKMIRFPKVGKEVIIGMFHTGDVFALPPVVDGEPYPASAVAVEPTQLLEIPRAAFLDLLATSPEMSLAVIRWMAGMLRDKTATIRNLAIASPDRRIAEVLAKLADAEQGPFPVTIGIRRQDIAEIASLTTETTIRTIRRLAGLGLVRIVRGKVIVDELGPLRQFVSD